MWDHGERDRDPDKATRFFLRPLYRPAEVLLTLARRARGKGKETPTPTSAAPKQRHPAGKTQTATVGDRTYAITREGDAWKATVKQGRKSTVLSTGSFGKAYTAVTRHNKEQAV